MATVSIFALRALAAIRLLNGLLGLLRPDLLIRRLDGDPAVQTIAPYPFRMFGVRTVLLGIDLLLLRGVELDRAARTAVVIHASDTASAAYGGIRKEVPARVAVMTTTISAVNTLLAIVGWRGRRSR
jgi:hypothetical protein